MEALINGWKNAYYRITMAYVAILVTLIFGFQMNTYFFAASSNDRCEHKISALTLLPVIGVLFYD